MDVTTTMDKELSWYLVTSQIVNILFPSSHFILDSIKGTESVVLMEIIGLEYEFLYVKVDINVRYSDG